MYEQGQRLTGKLQADYFFGKPVASGDVRVELRGKDGEAAELAKLEARTDAAGKAVFEFRLPTSLAGKPQHAGDASIAVVATVHDTAGQEQSKTVSTIVTAQPIHIEVLPETGRLVSGVANTIYILTSYPGRAARHNACRRERSRPRIEYQQPGAGVAGSHPAVEQQPLSRPPRLGPGRGRTAVREVELLTGQASGDFLVRTDKAVYTGGETMKVHALALRRSRADLSRSDQGRSDRADHVDGRVRRARSVRV